MAALGAVVAVGVAVLVGRLMIAIGPRLGFVDLPDEEGLKIHTGLPVPLGGVAVFTALHGGLAVAGQFSIPLLAATSMIWLLGVLDDQLSLSPWTRLSATSLAGVVLVATADWTGGILGGVAAVFVVVVTVNAVNMLDGLDMLAGSVSGVSALGLVGLAIAIEVGTPWGAAMLSASLLGFLVWNKPPARLFLGNNGAYVIGVVLAWEAIDSSSTWSVGIIAVAAIGLPLMELGATVLRRISGGESLILGDRNHTYDRLHAAGWSPIRIGGVFALAQGLWSILVIGIAIVLTPKPITAGLVLVLAVAATAATAYWTPKLDTAQR